MKQPARFRAGLYHDRPRPAIWPELAGCQQGLPRIKMKCGQSQKPGFLEKPGFFKPRFFSRSPSPNRCVLSSAVADPS